MAGKGLKAVFGTGSPDKSLLTIVRRTRFIVRTINRFFAQNYILYRPRSRSCAAGQDVSRVSPSGRVALGVACLGVACLDSSSSSSSTCLAGFFGSGPGGFCEMHGPTLPAAPSGFEGNHREPSVACAPHTHAAHASDLCAQPLEGEGASSMPGGGQASVPVSCRSASSARPQTPSSSMTAGASSRCRSQGAAGGGAAGRCPLGCRVRSPNGGSSSRRTRESAYGTAGRTPRRDLSSPRAAASARSRSGRGSVATVSAR